MAWNTKEGQLIVEKGTNYMAIFTRFFNTLQSKTSSYKYALVKCLLDNLFNVDSNYALDFSFLGLTFAKIYWNLISKYHLPQITVNSQFKKSEIETVVEDMIMQNVNLNNLDYDSLNDVDKRSFNLCAYKIFTKYVIGALYSDLQCKVYGFSKTNRKIYLNREIYDFLIKNKIILEKLNYYSWIIWMEERLEKTTNVLKPLSNYVNLGIKLDESTKRKALTNFKIDLLKYGDKLTCFYCNKIITDKSCHIDHFIPWKFVKDDKIWNLVISCRQCNESKKDKIPSIDMLDKLIARNENLFGLSYEDNLTQLRNSALYNGFIAWKL